MQTKAFVLMKPMLLLSAMLDENRDVILKFYDEENDTTVTRKKQYDEYSYADKTYSKLEGLDISKKKPATKIDPVTEDEIKLTKVFDRPWSFAREDVQVGEDANGKPITESKKSPKVWESDIKPYESYLHDQGFTPGMYYDVSGKISQADMPVPDSVTAELQTILESKKSGDFKQYLEEWARMLSQPIPHIRRTAIDIEIASERGQSLEKIMAEGENTITAISFKGDDIDKVLALGGPEDKKDGDGFDLVIYDDESEMLKDAFKTMEDYPVILTYNGTNFDLPYMEKRVEKLKKEGANGFEFPFSTRKNEGFGQSMYMVSMRKCIHVDLYNVMDNKVFQIYVFNNKYSKKGLGDVSKAILGRDKLDHDVFGEQDVGQLAKYCYHDSLLTYDLTEYEDEMLMNMLVIISRIAKMPLDDVARYRVSQWIRSRLYFQHRKNNWLIPNRADLAKRNVDTKDNAVTKGKKYKGGFVIRPEPGLYHDVVVVDFASLYPSIIKAYNISYETVRCPHEECRSNILPLTNHWCCTKRYGMTSLMIGSLRDLRVEYYKRLSKDESIPKSLRNQYEIVAQALKVILNASYGVIGADIFPLYFPPAAEAVTALGRSIIQGSVDICEKNGVDVLYGDSVLGDTPVICERNGVRQIVPIRSLIAPTRTNGRQKHAALKVLSDDGLVDVKYSYVHKVRKTGYRIGTRKAYVECTDDHSLIIGGKKVKPSSLKLGDSIDVSETPMFRDDYSLAEDVAWLFGFYLSDGTLGQYGSKKTWKIVKNDRAKLKKAQRIMSEHLGFDTTIRNYQSEGKLHTLISTNKSITAVTEYFKLHCYSNKTKIVPACVLNGTKQAKKAFLQGTIDGDGHVDKKDKNVTFGQVHKSILAGYISVITALGHDYSLKFRRDKPNFITVRIIRNAKDARIRKADAVTLLEKFDIDECVYDISTANGHFRGGLGNILLKNTDSVFILSPSDEQVEKITKEAREKYKVDLEIDKVYKFCVFSERKKNYYGMLDTGKMDVKGLAGKKSSTPPFVKDLFTKVMDKLSTITRDSDMEEITDAVTDMISKCISDVRKGRVPLEKMTFTTLLGANLQDYKVAVKQADVDPRVAGRETWKARIAQRNKPGQDQVTDGLGSIRQPSTAREGGAVVLREAGG